jgi:protein-tyrosine phosphatase
LYEAATLEKCNLLEYYDFTSRYAASVRRNVEKIIQTTAFGDKIELLTGVSVPNPCIFYEIDLKQLSEYHAMSHYMSFIHGDLNGRNIIIDAHENVWLIDFFHTHRGHIIRDLIKVENDLMFIMTPIEDEDELRQAFTLTDKLLDSDDLASQPFDQSIKFSSDALNKTARIIQHLRSYYPKLIQSDRAVYQYHVGLMRYAMHTISFDESSLLQKKWALYTGSLLSAKIRDFLQKTAKLRIDTINLDAWSSHGKLGMTILPGRRDRGRNLTDDIQQLKDDNTKSVLSLITVDELSIYGVSNLESEYKKAGIEYRNLPIVDQKIPDKEGLNQTLSWIDEQLKIGNVVLHCVGGLGRSGVVAACYLKKYYGLNGADAIATVRSTRGQRAVETKYQENFVLDFT